MNVFPPEVIIWFTFGDTLVLVIGNFICCYCQPEADLSADLPFRAVHAAHCVDLHLHTNL